MIRCKVKTQKEITEIIEKEKASGKKVGFTNGCFDLLHLGHVRYLADARGECDLLIVGLNSDASTKRLKGKERPINPQEARAEVLAALESVDFVAIFEEDTPEDLIKALTPDVLFKGGDWEESEIAGASHVKASGGEVKIIPFEEGYSTTELIERLRK